MKKHVEIESQIKDFIGKYSINLDYDQMRAMSRTHGKTLVLAVPGSGKTTMQDRIYGQMLRNRSEEYISCSVQCLSCSGHARQI